MKEIVVISGKGGTGKTSLTASLAALSRNKVLADCDVDAADLHLVLRPEVLEQHDFSAGREARIRPEACLGCGGCLAHCRFEAVIKEDSSDNEYTFRIDPIVCEGCGVCVHFCPAGAIDFPEKVCGQWFVSETSHGPMVHARLGVAEENSGKLVTLVRRQSQRIGEERGLELMLTDGPPGIGCPVIASITGASLVLAVCEPTLSGVHDLKRVVKLTRHFQIATAVCINKYDINPELSRSIETYCREHSLPLLGAIPYDTDVIRAQLAGVSVVEFSEGPAARQMEQLWHHLHAQMEI
jgi:MinD superfamily P-loop ATPase